MKKFFINNGGSLSMLLAPGTLVFDDFFGEYLQPFENLLLNIITYIIIVLFNSTIVLFKVAAQINLLIILHSYKL